MQALQEHAAGIVGTGGRMSVFPRKPLAVAIAIARVRSTLHVH